MKGRRKQQRLAARFGPAPLFRNIRRMRIAFVSLVEAANTASASFRTIKESA